MTFCVLPNLAEHAGHGKDDIFITDSVLKKVDIRLGVKLRVHYKPLFYCFCRWGGSQFFLFEYLEGQFFLTLYGEGLFLYSVDVDV